MSDKKKQGGVNASVVKEINLVDQSKIDLDQLITKGSKPAKCFRFHIQVAGEVFLRNSKKLGRTAFHKCVKALFRGHGQDFRFSG